MRNYFNEDEIVLCTYAAMYDAQDYGGIDKIYQLHKRSVSSIQMKIQNIASMLDEGKIQRFNYGIISPLTGLPPGKKGRKTNWNIVEKLYPLERTAFLRKCKDIIERI